MATIPRYTEIAAAIIAGAIMLTAAPASAQTPPAVATTALPQSTIKALQEALNKQGITVSTDGVFSDETRAAIRKYQSQHHLPVTGEPDKATLTKLGVPAGQSAAQEGQAGQDQASSTTGAGSPAMGPQMMGGMMPGMMSGGMMNCPMMGGQAQGGAPTAMGRQAEQMPQSSAQGQMMAMMQMMQGMMQMMQSMQAQMQNQSSGQMQPPAAR